MNNVILRLPEVMKASGLSRSSIYAMMQDGTFPKNVRLGARAVGWLKSDVENWIESKTVTAMNVDPRKQV